MKRSTDLTVKIITAFVLLILVCAGFMTHVVLGSESPEPVFAAASFCLLVLALFAAYAFMLRMHMRFVLSRLSDVISSLADMRCLEEFSALNDDMLSKLQSQVIKLSGVLRAQNARMKSERDEIRALVSDISHQLKTPLANLKVYMGLLQAEDLSAAQRAEFMRSLQGQLDRLCFLTESFIKLSRLESGVIQLNGRMESLNETCLTAVRQIFQKAREKNIEIGFVSDGDIRLVHDPNWTAEAVFNILDNAVKYTDAGGKVEVKVERYDLFARIAVADTGPGIEEGEINRIFARFYRGRNAANQEGVGLGLYLSRDIVHKQGGYVKVRSKKGEGSIFSLFLPLNWFFV